MKAVIVESPDRVVIRDTDAPSPGPYEALVRMEAGCLCNSTDAKLISGHFPGQDHYPMILGHEGVGTIVRTGDRVRSFEAGDRVIGALNLFPAETDLASGWGAFAEYALAGDHEAMKADNARDEAHGWQEVHEIMKKVPDGIPNEEAALLCTWREVWGGFSDFQLHPDRSVLVFGAGPVGQSFVKMAAIKGLSPIIVTDRVDWKMEHALHLGADAAIPADGPDFVATARKTASDGFDYVIDAVGSPAIVNTAVRLVGMGGSICVYGVISDGAFTIDKTPGPYNWNLLIHQWPTRKYESAAQEPLCALIREGRLSADDFITHRYSITDIGEAIAEVKQGKTLKVFLTFDWA